jgi:hypothetical protein
MNSGCGICDGYKYGVRGRGLAERRDGNLAIWEIEGFIQSLRAWHWRDCAECRYIDAVKIQYQHR